MKQFDVVTVKIDLNYWNTFEKWSNEYIYLLINLWIEMICGVIKKMTDSKF